MRIQYRILIGVAATALAATSAVPMATANGGAADSVAVTKVLVNKLGGVTVQGTVACPATAQLVRDGFYDYALLEQSGRAYETGDEFALLVNADNYAVTQPTGRKSSVTVGHASSRMHPCYTDLLLWPDGTAVRCQVGQLCPWTTDRYGWNEATPLFDYPDRGRFATGNLSVTGYVVGLFIQVRHVNPDDSVVWFGAFIGDNDGNTLYLPYQQALRAVAYRG